MNLTLVLGLAISWSETACATPPPPTPQQLELSKALDALEPKLAKLEPQTGSYGEPIRAGLEVQALLEFDRQIQPGFRDCSIEVDAPSGHLLLAAPRKRCVPACDRAALPALTEVDFWDRSGDATATTRIAAACGASPALAWIPKDERAKMLPTDLLGLVEILDPVVRVAADDDALEGRLRGLTDELVEAGVAGGGDGLVIQVVPLLRVITMVAPERKLEMVSTELARIATANDLPGGDALQGFQWPPTGPEASAETARWMKDHDGACLKRGEGAALSQELAGSTRTEALRRLLARCDALGHDPIYAGPLWELIHKNLEEAGNWREPDQVRQSAPWERYWLSRTASEPVLAALGEIGTPLATGTQTALRTWIIVGTPDARVSPKVLALAAPTGSADPAALARAVGSLSGVAQDAEVIPSDLDFSGRSTWQDPVDLETALQTAIPPAALPGGDPLALAPGSGKLSRAFLLWLIPQLEAAAAGEPQEAEARGALERWKAWATHQ